MVAEQTVLIELLTLRGHVLGRVADYERAAQQAELLVLRAPDEWAALLERTRTRATLHRYSEALLDLDAAERCGCDSNTLNAELAAILQAVGYSENALILRLKAAEQRPTYSTLAALAVLHGERREIAEAERLFGQAQQEYQEVSPFPVAALDFRRGLMWYKESDLGAARRMFDAARRRVPAYAPAIGYLAKVEAALGIHDEAIARLRPLAQSSDDPRYAANLSAILCDAGRVEEDDLWRTRAAQRYDQILLSHPQSFNRDAAHFWATVGGNPRRGRRLALRDAATGAADRAYVMARVLITRRSESTASQDLLGYG